MSLKRSTVTHTSCIGARTSDVHGQHRFTQQLLELDSNRPLVPQQLPEVLCQISTPASSEVWRRELAGHPDQAFTNYVVQGLEQGFRVGFRYPSSLLPHKRNMLSAVQHPQVVRDYLKEELALNRVVRFPKPAAEQLGVHCSPIAGPAEAIWVWYGKMGYVNCRRQCVEARSADLYNHLHNLCTLQATNSRRKWSIRDHKYTQKTLIHAD